MALMNAKTTLKQGIMFHGHLGPWLVLGLKMGEYALEKLAAKKYFGISARVWGVNNRPKSCLIDGLQLSSGATYGKGNIHKFSGRIIRMSFTNSENKKKIQLALAGWLLKELSSLKGHADSEACARRLWKMPAEKLFTIRD